MSPHGLDMTLDELIKASRSGSKAQRWPVNRSPAPSAAKHNAARKITARALRRNVPPLQASRAVAEPALPMDSHGQVAVTKHAPIQFTLQPSSRMTYGQSLEQIAQRNRQQQLADRRKLNAQRQPTSARATDHTQSNAQQQPGQPKQRRIASWGGSQRAPQQHKHWPKRPGQPQHNWQQRQFKKQKMFTHSSNNSSSSHFRPAAGTNHRRGGKRVPFRRGRPSMAALSTHMGSLDMQSAGRGGKACTTAAHQKQQRQQHLAVHGGVRKAHAPSKKQQWQQQKGQQQRTTGRAVPKAGRASRRTAG